MVVSSAQGSARDFSTWGGGFLEDGGRDGLETGQRQRDPSMGGWDIKWLGWVGGRDILGGRWWRTTMEERATEIDFDE